MISIALSQIILIKVSMRTQGDNNYVTLMSSNFSLVNEFGVRNGFLKNLLYLI
jgi:hypothetical protein